MVWGNDMPTPVRQPIQRQLAFKLTAGQSNAGDSFLVPKAKRFVIEFVTAIFTVQIGPEGRRHVLRPDGGEGAAGTTWHIGFVGAARHVHR